MDPIFDTHIYGPSNKFEGYRSSISLKDDDDEDQQRSRSRDLVKKMSSYTAPRHLISELQLQANDDEENNRKPYSRRIIDRENDYLKRRLNRKLSPPRCDPFAVGDRSPQPSLSTYADVMRENAFQRLEHETYRLISLKRKDISLKRKDISLKRKDKEQGSSSRCKEDEDTYAEKKRKSDLEGIKSSGDKTRARISSRDRRTENYSAHRKRDY